MLKLAGQRKAFCILILIITAILLKFSAFVSAAPDTKNLEMSVKAGYDDMVRVGSSAPFYITLINKGERFSGEAQVFVDTGYRTKTVYAVSFELPEGSTKELTIDVPIRTANRKVEVRIESRGKTIKKFEYGFKKLIAPEDPTIGVLSDAANQLRILNGLKLIENMDAMPYEKAIKMKAMIAAGEIVSTSDRPSVLIQLDKDSLPHTLEALSTFDYIIVADFDTSLLSEKQIEGLEKWVDSGKKLVLAGGTNGRKVYSGLSSSLKPFKMLEIRKSSLRDALEKFTEKDAPEAIVDVSTGDMGNGGILMGDEANPLAFLYSKGNGKIIFLAFDPTLSPVSVWENAGEMWRKLLTSNPASTGDIIGAYYNAPGPVYYDDMGLVNQVPESQTPPFKALLWLIAFYIIIVGPLLYLFLKWKDRRDWNWLAVPALAFLCMGIIYVAGFKTRYTSAVLNNFSIIRLDEANKKADIETLAGAFNNQRGKMTVEYPHGFGIEVKRNNEPYYSYSYNSFSPDDYKNALVTGKIIQGEPNIHELYNVAIWEPTYISSKQTQSYSGSLIRDVNISGNKFSATIRNDTGFALEESFMSVGNNFIYVGTILPNEEKKIEVMLNDPGIKKSYEQFIDSRYISNYYPRSANLPKDWKEQARKRNAFDQVFRSVIRTMNLNNLHSAKVTLFALNFDNVDYNIKVNGKEPKKYNTNVVYSVQEIFFEKNKRVDIPTGMISAIYEGGDNVGFEGSYNESIRVFGDSEVFFKFVLPQDIQVNRFKIDWMTSIPLNLKSQYSPPKTGQNALTNNNCKLYVYNNVSLDWESIGEVFEPQGDISPYIGEFNVIKLKVDVTLDKASGQTEYLWKPEIQLSGVVK